MLSTALIMLSSARIVHNFFQVGVPSCLCTASSHIPANNLLCSLGLPRHLISSSSAVDRPDFSPTEYQSVTMYRRCTTSSAFGGSYNGAESAWPAVISGRGAVKRAINASLVYRDPSCRLCRRQEGSSSTMDRLTLD